MFLKKNAKNCCFLYKKNFRQKIIYFCQRNILFLKNKLKEIGPRLWEIKFKLNKYCLQDNFIEYGKIS